MRFIFHHFTPFIMKKILFFSLILLFLSSCEQKNGKVLSSKTNDMLIPKDTIVGIKGCDLAQMEETKDGKTYNYTSYKVSTLASKTGVGEDITIVGTDKKDVFNIKNTDAHHFFGIKQDFLFVDNGTGPNGRSVLIYDLKKQSLIHEAAYEADMNIEQSKMTYKTPIDTRNIRLMASVCPDKDKWEKQGLGVGYAMIMVFDLTTKEVISTGEYTCFPIQ